MDGADKQLCDLIQNELPLTERPYAALGEQLGTSEAEVIERVTRLRGERIIRQVSAIFDTRKLGYTSMLVAARMKSEEYRQISRGYVSADPLAANRSWSGRYHRYYYEVKHEASAEAGREVPHRVDVWQADGKGGQMVWTALGRGVDPASADDVGREVTKSLVPEMARAGVIPD